MNILNLGVGALMLISSVAGADVVPTRVTVDGEFAGTGIYLKVKPEIGNVFGYGSGSDRVCYVVNDVVYMVYGPGVDVDEAVAAEIDVSEAECSSAAYVNPFDQP